MARHAPWACGRALVGAAACCLALRPLSGEALRHPVLGPLEAGRIVNASAQAARNGTGDQAGRKANATAQAAYNATSDQEAAQAIAIDAARVKFRALAAHSRQLRSGGRSNTTDESRAKATKAAAEPFDVKKEMQPIIQVFKARIEEQERLNEYGGSQARADFCEAAKRNLTEARDINAAPADDAPKMQKEVYGSIMWGLEEAEKEIQFLCDDHVDFNGRLQVLEERSQQMVQVMKKVLESMVCKRGDILCVGGAPEGVRPDCACTCSEGWEHGEAQACEKCNNIAWTGGEWSVCSREGFQTREVSCNCATPKPGFHFDESKCAAHPARLATAQACTYQPLRLVTGAEEMTPTCADHDLTSNVFGGFCKGGLQQGFFFDASKRLVSEKDKSKCLTFDTSKKHECHLEQHCRQVEKSHCYLWVEDWCSWWREPHLECWQEQRCLEVKGDQNVKLASCGSQSNQQWVFESNGELRSKADAEACLDLNSVSKNIYMHPCTGGWNQLWRLTRD